MSYEYAAKGVSKEIENLNEVPIQIIASWIKKFEREGSFYISNLDLEKDREDERAYECLKAQNVNSLIAVPLIRNREIIGFTVSFLNSVLHYEPLGHKGTAGKAAVSIL